MRTSALMFEPQALSAPAMPVTLATAFAPAPGAQSWDPAAIPMPAMTDLVTEVTGGLPLLQTSHTMLRELRLTDASSLLALLSTEEVSKFLSPPPTTIDGYVKFIEWAKRERRAGRHACFAIVPRGGEHAVGIFQVRRMGSGWDTAEWGFAMGSGYWGTGLFLPSAEAVVRFAFDRLDVHRLEARAALRNGRGTGALLKVGARQEAVLRRGLVRHGEYLDQGLWVILRDEWRMPVQPTSLFVN